MNRWCVLLISKLTCLGKLPHLTSLLELEFLKHQQILQILGYCLVLFLFNVNMPSCPSPWRRVCAWAEGYSTSIWVWHYPQFYCHVWDKQQNPHCLVLKPFIVWQNYCRSANLCYSNWFTFENLEYKNFIKQIKWIICCMQYRVYNWGQTCTKLYSLFSTNFREIVYPVWDRDDKNHTLSFSSTSLHRPYKGLHPQVPKQHLQKFWKFVPWGV